MSERDAMISEGIIEFVRVILVFVNPFIRFFCVFYVRRILIVHHCPCYNVGEKCLSFLENVPI